jgi:hypothetical protein
VRDIDAALAGMTEDVDWPNGWEGGYVKGDAAGTVLFDQQVLHVYAYRGELVHRMTIEAAD